MTKKDQIIEEIRKIYDPELPVNIYELGLIYDIKVEGRKAEIKMTLTTPNCPVAETLPNVCVKRQSFPYTDRNLRSDKYFTLFQKSNDERSYLAINSPFHRTCRACAPFLQRRDSSQPTSQQGHAPAPVRMPQSRSLV